MGPGFVGEERGRRAVIASMELGNCGMLEWLRVGRAPRASSLMLEDRGAMELWNSGISEVGKELQEHQVQGLRIVELWDHGGTELWNQNHGVAELWNYGIMGL